MNSSNKKKPSTKSSAINWLKRYLPQPKKIKENKYLNIFGTLLHDPNLFHFNRHSVARAFSLSLFICYIPLPGHMLLATFGAIFFKTNLPLSLLLVWVANPFTMPPMYYFGYRIGAWILRIPSEHFHFEMSFHWVVHEFQRLFTPLILGCLVCGAMLAILGNIGIRLVWRYSVAKAWRERAVRRKSGHSPNSGIR